jgi:hypothetical protein
MQLKSLQKVGKPDNILNNVRLFYMNRQCPKEANMLSRATPFGHNLRFVPLPENARRAVYDSLIDRGFVHEAILDSYNFTGRRGGFTVNMLAFADRVRRTPAEYAGCTIYNATNGLADREIILELAQTAAPFHIIHREDKFSFWASTLDGKVVEPSQLLTDISYHQLSQALQEYRVDLAPDQIVSVKQGRGQFVHPHLRKLEPLQLALWAIDVTRDTLVDRFGQAVTQLRTDMGDQPNVSDREITSLAIKMLGATILVDTGVFGASMRRQGLDLSLDQLFFTAAEQYPTYFRAMLDFQNDYDTIERAYRTLRQIYYSGFVPDMLSALYTRAYSKEQRKKRGFYDTPLYLTRRILQNIPIEFLPPEQRIVVDMGCGWGSFLIAGTERLSQINDMRGRQLREHIIGNDIDVFTAQLAGLGLLLSTSEDSWRIDHENALTWPWLDTQQPQIIVGNPPFGGRRDQPETLDELMLEQGERKRVESANAHLEKAIRYLSPGGYLAMVMPRSFLASESAPTVRRKLLENCDVTEIWELPSQVFPEVSVQPIVIFARKRAQVKKVSFPVRVRNIQNSSLPSFRTERLFTASGMFPDQSLWNEASRLSPKSKTTHIMSFTTILSYNEWQILRAQCDNLEDVATTFSGLIPGAKLENNRWSSWHNNRTISWLTNARRVVPRPWFIDYAWAKRASYPQDFERPRMGNVDTLSSEKVLFVAKTDPSWGLRSKAVIERKGFYPSDSFWVVSAERRTYPQITNEVLAAILNWHVSNAWVSENVSYRRIERRTANLIPIPRNISPADCVVLTECVHKLEDSSVHNRPLPENALQTIDRILRSAYNLDDATYARLRVISEWDEHPQITLDPQPDRSVADYVISGIVEDVQAEQGTLSLWISGFDDIQTVPIDSLMPGWMLRPDTPFRAKIPFINKRKRSLDGVVWNSFTPQQHTYQDESELIQELSHIFGSGGE